MTRRDIPYERISAPDESRAFIFLSLKDDAISEQRDKTALLTERVMSGGRRISRSTAIPTPPQRFLISRNEPAMVPLAEVIAEPTNGILPPISFAAFSESESVLDEITV